METYRPTGQSFLNERGNMFVFSLIILIVFSIMGLGLMTMTMNTLKNTTTERDDQAVYYIAEAGLVKQRAQIYNEVKTIYTQLKATYEQIEEPQMKSEFNFDEQFTTEVLSLAVPSDQPLITAHEDHFGQAAFSEVKVERIINGPHIEFLITSIGKIGESWERTVSQSVAISLDNVRQTEEVTIGDGKPDTKLNACYTLFTYGGMAASGGGTFNGDIYSTEALNMTASPVINGSIYSTENINITGTPQQLKGVYSEKNISMSGGGDVYGNVHANGKVIITNMNNISGDIIAGGDVENVAHVAGGIRSNGAVTQTRGTANLGISAKKPVTIKGGTVHQFITSQDSIAVENGSVTGYMKAAKDVYIKGGTVTNDIFSSENIQVSSWPTIRGEMIAKGHISIASGTFDGGLRAITKGNIQVSSWTVPTKTIYAGTLTTQANYKKPDPVTEAEANTLIQQYEQNITSMIHAYEPTPVRMQNECGNSVPKLEMVDTVFVASPRKPSSFTSIELPTLYTGEYLIEAANDVQINNIELYSDTNNRIRHFTLALNKPSGVLDVTRTNLRSNSTLALKLSSNHTIHMKELTTAPDSNLVFDLQHGHHTLFVDTMNIAGNIELLNPGTLNIYVKDTMSLTNSRINTSGESQNISIYYAGSRPFTLDGGSYVNSNLHVKNADLTLTASGHVYGDVYVYGINKVTVNGGASAAQQLFLAPRSEFNLGGGATINGNVVANLFKSSGGFTINAPEPASGGGGGGTIILPIDDYGDAEDLFQRSPQLEK